MKLLTYNDILEKIVNHGNEDHHMHSLNFSDGSAPIDEIARNAGDVLKLKTITITDHSQAYLDVCGFTKKNSRSTTIFRWKNTHNDAEILFGGEADILNEDGDICSHIQGIEFDFMILSAHRQVYKAYGGDLKKITQAYLNAIKRHHEKINLIGHLSANYFVQDGIDVMPIINLCNYHGIPIEIDGANLLNGKTNLENLEKVLNYAVRIYVNSDAHHLNELRDARPCVFNYLKKKGLWVKE